MDCFEPITHELTNDFCQNVDGLSKSTREKGQRGHCTFWPHCCRLPKWIYGSWPINRVHSFMEHKNNVILVCCNNIDNEPIVVWWHGSLIPNLLWPWALKGDAKTHERNIIQQGIQTLDSHEFHSSMYIKSLSKKQRFGKE